MKNLRFNFLTIVATVFCMLFLTACPGDDKEPDILSASPTSLRFSADETGEQMVTVTTNVSSWTYSGGDSWLDVYKKQDDNLYVKAQNYTNTESSRTSTVTISAGDATPVTINITQTAKEISNLSVNPTSLSFEGNEIGDKTVAITTDAPGWDATTDASWLTLSKQDKTLKVTVNKENTGSSDRSANIKITAGNAPEITLKVTQTASIYLTVNPTSLQYEANETGEKTVTVSTNASGWNATTTASWLTLSKSGNSLKVDVKTQNSSNTPLNAEIKITADKAPDVILPVTQKGSGIMTYNTAEGYYWGNYLGTGYANYILDIYNASDENIGFMIDGFCDLPSSFSTFKITAGTYSVATTGKRQTFWPGKVSDDDKIYGTYVYNFNTQQFILVTGGNYTVELSGSTYTITTNFTGTNYSTGATVNNIKLKYTGTIKFDNKSNDPAFGQIPASSYSATGTSLFDISGANYSSWSGKITPIQASSKQYYTITNWGRKDITVRCNYSGGKISLDNKTPVFENASYYGYFSIGTYNSSTKTATLYYNLTYYPTYSTSTKTLSFAGTYNGLPTCTGIVLISKSTGEAKGFLNNMHLGPKLVLSSTSSTQLLSGSEIFRPDEIPSSGIVLFKDLKGYTIKTNDTFGTNLSPELLIKSRSLEKGRIK